MNEHLITDNKIKKYSKGNVFFNLSFITDTDKNLLLFPYTLEL